MQAFLGRNCDILKILVNFVQNNPLICKKTPWWKRTPKFEKSPNDPKRVLEKDPLIRGRNTVLNPWKKLLS